MHNVIQLGFGEVSGMWQEVNKSRSASVKR